MDHGLAGLHPGMGQQPDAAGQVAGDGHLLAIEQGHLLPARLAAGDRRREAGIQIGGHREGHRHHLVAHELVALDQRLHQLGHGSADRFDRVGLGGGGAPQGPELAIGAHGAGHGR